MWFALARDDQGFFAKVSVRFRTPYRAVFLLVFIAAAASIPLVTMGRFVQDLEDIFVQLLALSLISLHLAYAIPILLKLYKRLVKREAVLQGPWHVGKLEVPIDVCAAVWLILSAVGTACLLEKTLLIDVVVTLILVLLVTEWKRRQVKRAAASETGLELNRSWQGGFIRFSEKTADEMLRIERKYPQNE
jgi:amino acid transporter